jgi:hypothetical protein
LTKRFNHKNFTIGYSHLYFFTPTWLTELNDFEFSTFFTFDPFHTLKLGINQKWISIARAYD